MYVARPLVFFEVSVSHPILCHELAIRLAAITTQHILTYGLSRSPTLAHFQKIPKTPSRFLSIIFGKVAWAYVDVHITSKRTSSNDWKLNSADMVLFVSCKSFS